MNEAQRESVADAIVMAIDPGTSQSAIVEIALPSMTVIFREILPNEEVLVVMRAGHWFDGPVDVAIEMIASYGMPVGAEVFETCVWIGRFMEATQLPVSRVFRREVKLSLCGSPRAKDGNIRQALIDMYGPGKEKAIGLKASPGPLYGMKADMWAALGVAVTFARGRPGLAYKEEEV